MLKAVTSKHPRRMAVLITAALGFALVAGGIASAALGAVRDGEVMPGTSVSGVDLSGLDRVTAARRIERLAGPREARDVVVVHGDTSFTVSAAQIGFDVDVDATVDAAYASGRDASPLATLAGQIPATFSATDLQIVQEIDEERLATRANAIARSVERAPSVGTLEIDPVSLVVSTTPPLSGRTVDLDETVRMLRSAFTAVEEPVPLDLPVIETAPLVTDADVEAAAALARIALTADLTLRGPEEGSATITPAELATMLDISSENGGSSIGLSIDADRLEAVVGDQATAFGRDPVDASFDIPRKPPVSIDAKGDVTFTPQAAEVPVIPSRPGTTFGAEPAAMAISATLERGEHEAVIPLIEQPATFTTDDAEALGIDELLASFTTYHDCCASRVTNIQLLADMVDGTVLRPGEQFSINQISLTRTCAAGFRAAGMILNGEIVDVCGGGVSQFGTTMFNAAFFSGAQLDDWKAHSFYISRYPRGREATLNYPNPDIDVRFTNTTAHGMLVRTSYTSTSITVAIYGHSDIATVSATHSAPYDYRSFSTRFKENKALAPGKSRTTQSGAQGFSVDILRTTTFDDGSTEDFDFTTVYVPKLKIVERNTDTPPPPPPPPAEEPTPPAPEDA